MVLGVDALQGIEVALHLVAIDEGPEELALVEQVDALRRREDVLDVPRLQVVGRDQLADAAGEVHQQQEGRETTAGRWRRKRHHISFHWPAM